MAMMALNSRGWMRAGFWFTIGAAWAALLCWTFMQLAAWMWKFVVEEWPRTGW